MGLWETCMQCRGAPPSYSRAIITSRAFKPQLIYSGLPCGHAYNHMDYFVHCADAPPQRGCMSEHIVVAKGVFMGSACALAGGQWERPTHSGAALVCTLFAFTTCSMGSLEVKIRAPHFELPLYIQCMCACACACVDHRTARPQQSCFPTMPTTTTAATAIQPCRDFRTFS